MMVQIQIASVFRTRSREIRSALASTAVASQQHINQGVLWSQSFNWRSDSLVRPLVYLLNVRYVPGRVDGHGQQLLNRFIPEARR